MRIEPSAKQRIESLCDKLGVDVARWLRELAAKEVAKQKK